MSRTIVPTTIRIAHLVDHHKAPAPERPAGRRPVVIGTSPMQVRALLPHAGRDQRDPHRPARLPRIRTSASRDLAWRDDLPVELPPAVTGCQSSGPVLHLEPDAASALPGDVGTLNEREVRRLLLNLSRSSKSCTTATWIRGPPNLSRMGHTSEPMDPERLQTAACVAVIPPRMRTTATAWHLPQIGCCTSGSTASADTSSRARASRRPDGAAPLDAP